MARKGKSGGATVLRFPFPDWDEANAGREPTAEAASPGTPRPRSAEIASAVLCGTYRKDLPGLRRTYESLRDLGFRLLSPSNVSAVSERDGFVFMRGEETMRPDVVEQRHLDAIQRAHFVWLFAPDGYVGPTAALEVGFAQAMGIPVFSDTAPKDVALRTMVRVVSSDELPGMIQAGKLPTPAPAIGSFQEYYARAARHRGYESETIQDCLLLMIEEVGELARALRKRQRLRRDSEDAASPVAEELADVFIYVVHMANVLKLDLGKAVWAKEQVNIRRFVERASREAGGGGTS